MTVDLSKSDRSLRGFFSDKKWMRQLERYFRGSIWLLLFSLALPSFRFIMMLLEKDLSLTFRPLLLLRLPELAIIHFTSRRLDSWRAPRPASTVSAVSSSQTIRTPPDFPRPGRQILVQTFRQTNQVTPSRASFLGNISPSHSSVAEAGSISVSERRSPRSPKYAYRVGTRLFQPEKARCV